MDLRDWAIKSWHVLQEWRFVRSSTKYGGSYDASLTQFEMEIVISAVIDALIQELVDGGTLTISELGRISTVEKPAQTLRSNLDGRIHQMNARRRVVFKPSAALLRRLNDDS